MDFEAKEELTPMINTKRPQTKGLRSGNTQYFTNIDGKYVKDAEARQQLNDLEDYVEGIAPVALSVTENGTYTAPTGVFGYSPVSVDTGIYVGTNNPSASLGKNGDYYYKRDTTFKAYDDAGLSASNSGQTWIGWDFTVSTDISITKMSALLSGSSDFKFCIGTEAEVLYESDTIGGVSGNNELTLSTPVQLTAGTYCIYIVLNGTKGRYYNIDNVRLGTIGKGLTVLNGRYGGGTYRPATSDNTAVYAVDFEYTTAEALVVGEYYKKSGAWVQL